MKIFIDKNEEVASVIEKVISASESDVVLVIPKGNKIKDSASNLHLLKRESAAAGKSISIESVDEEVLSLAKKEKIEAVHPLLKNDVPKRSLRDIVMPQVFEVEGIGHKGKSEKKSAAQKEIVSSEEAEKDYSSLTVFDGKLSPGEDYGVEEEKESGLEESAVQRKSFLRYGKNFIYVFFVFILLVLGGVFFINTFGKASIVVNLKKSPWRYEGNFLADVRTKKIDVAKNVLPAEVFSFPKNTTQFFPASGKAQVSRKAGGKILIYNAYSSEPQVLVASTRFESPDGKIFRINNQVVVPGAKIENGKIIPSSIETSITADKAGAEYNVGPLEKLTIPGFKGSPRYEGFYGSIKEPLTGGYVGEMAVPTDDDISRAEKKTEEILKTTLESNFLSSRPEGFKILDGAFEIKINKLSVNKTTDERGNFSVLGGAELKAIAFLENDLKSLLLGKISPDEGEKVFRELELKYEGVKADYTNGQVVFSVKANGVLVNPFSADDLKKKLAGKKIKEVQSILTDSGFASAISDAKISLWPWRPGFFMNFIPKNLDKIDIKVN